MPKVYLSLGSNLGDRKQNLIDAIHSLNSNDLAVESVSSLYETVPIGETEQPVPDYLNVAARIDTDLKPLELLERIKQIEIACGRTKSFRWGPRIIDIDILLYDNCALETETLTIPHPRMAERAFTIVPVLEIAPEAVLPGDVPISGLLTDEIKSQTLVNIGKLP